MNKNHGYLFWCFYYHYSVVNIILHHTGHTFTQFPLGELDMYWQIVLDAFQLTLFVLFFCFFYFNFFYLFFINLQTTLTIHEKTYLQYFALRYLLTYNTQ